MKTGWWCSPGWTFLSNGPITQITETLERKGRESSLLRNAGLDLLCLYRSFGHRPGLCSKLCQIGDDATLIPHILSAPDWITFVPSNVNVMKRILLRAVTKSMAGMTLKMASQHMLLRRNSQASNVFPICVDKLSEKPSKMFGHNYIEWIYTPCKHYFHHLVVATRHKTDAADRRGVSKPHD